MNNTTRMICFASGMALCALLSGCGEKPESSGHQTAQQNLKEKPGVEMALNEVDRFFIGLKKWEEVSPPKKDGDTPGEKTKVKEGKYVCEEQKFDLTKTPQEIVVFGEASDLWPVALLQGEPYSKGQLRPLPLEPLATRELTINIKSDPPYETVQKPSRARMEEAIVKLLKRADSKSIPTTLNYTFKESFSSEQLLLDLNLSAKFLNQQAKASLHVENSAESKTLSAYFVQKMFSVSISSPVTPSRFFDDLKMEDIEDQVELRALGKGNPPLYVKSITYGRVLLFTMTSTSSMSEMKAALEYAYRGGADVDADAKASYKKILAGSQIHVVNFGGPWQEAARLIRSANIQEYFSDEAPPLESAVPISYELYSLGEGLQATVAETTNYSKRTCHVPLPDPIRKNGKFVLQDATNNKYWSRSEWHQVGLAGKWPYPTLQLKPVNLQFKGGNEPLTSGTSIRFKTTEVIADNRKLYGYTELGAFAAKKYVLYDKPDRSTKQDWVFKKTCKKCDSLIRFGDTVTIYNARKGQYLCNDQGKSYYPLTRDSACKWKILAPR